MNKKLFFSLVYLITGTFILLVVLVIIAINFKRDARIVELLSNILTKFSK